MQWQNGKQKLLQQLHKEIEKRLPAGKAEQLCTFAAQAYESFPAEDLRERDLSDLYGMTLGNWSYLQKYDSTRPKVRLFNPNYEQHQWQCGHTVIAILCPNMTFAMDSVRGELNSRNITIHTIHVATFRALRDENHQLLELLRPRDNGSAGDGQRLSEEMLIYLEINRHTDEALLAQLQQALEDILVEVAITVEDFKPMVEKVREVIATIADTPLRKPLEVREVQAFLEWMINSHFTFLGYEVLQVRYEKDGTPRIEKLTKRTLGLLRLRGSFAQHDLYQEIVNNKRDALLNAQLSFSQSSVRSRVHRRVYPDYIGVRVFDKQGRVTEEHRFLGMYTALVYSTSPLKIPVIRDKVKAVFEHAGLEMESHDGGELLRILETYPRDELFQSTEEELSSILMGILQIQERRQVRLFVRRDRHDKFVSCLVYTPRDLYNTSLRVRMEQLLCDAFGATESEFTTFFSESVLTRTYFVLRVDPTHRKEQDASRLEQELVKITMTWSDHLREHLVEEFGEEQGSNLANEYQDAFPPGYRDDCEPRGAVNDIRKIMELASDDDIAMSFFRHMDDAENEVRFRLFHYHVPIPLSDVMPILENLGLRVVSERPYGVRRRDGCHIWIHEFSLVYGLAEQITIDEVNNVFKEAFSRIWFGDAESDSFNKLVIGTQFGWRPVAMLRAYARYMKQIQFSFSADYIADTLGRHLHITKLLVRYFKQRFNPDVDEAQRGEGEQQLRDELLEALDGVENLSEDRIIREYMALISATARTNYFQHDAEGRLKSYFSFKLTPEAIPDMPRPKPKYEIFVYSPRVEGVHLRGGKVARGGLRWSDRLEDFRTEILGLVKAQQVKNAVIVPAGAKGGFVARQLPPGGGREQVQAEGIACYRIFIQGLLDITDNLVEGEVVPPPRVVRKDDDDNYLVVAADKGTATFSDIANEIAGQYDFWLGDAFASGGSVGYDHKKMAITARGAWVAVQRHFREMGVNIQEQDFTVVGIGDMSGDVFGNGMLLSEHIQLVAAFNHLHIFIDPNPDPAKTFAERKRLFEMSRSSWEDFNAELISKGGGVFRRAAKSISISKQMKARFGIKANSLTPNELISALLRAPVDLIWNGGIGTYVKSSRETHSDVGDKANDSLRINGRDLRCKVVGEGGNLGVTQLGRVEFALNGGRINTDFIDNAGGVDCSDHEVNIKILLNGVMAAGDMTEKQRRKLLEAMTDSVAELVLDNVYLQTQAISMAERDAYVRLGEYQRLINQLESSGRLNRALEYIPDEEILTERKSAQRGLTRPELSVLTSYVKSQLKETLADSPLVDDPAVTKAVESAFPPRLRKQFRDEIYSHRLRREIIATQWGNDLVNHMGITFCHRITQSTGAELPSVAAAYVIARDVFDAPTSWRQIEQLDYEIEAQLQMEMMAKIVRLVRRAARWFIRNRRGQLQPGREMEIFKKSIEELRPLLPDMLHGSGGEQWRRYYGELCEKQVPEQLARAVASADVIYPLLGIIDAAREINAPVRRVAEMYFRLAEELELDWFAGKINELKIENHWQALARESFRDDLEWQLRSLSVSAMKYVCEGDEVAVCVNRLKDQQQTMLTRWRNMLAELHSASGQDFAMMSVAVRELLDLAQSSRFEQQ